MSWKVSACGDPAAIDENEMPTAACNSCPPTSCCRPDLLGKLLASPDTDAIELVRTSRCNWRRHQALTRRPSRGNERNPAPPEPPQDRKAPTCKFDPAPVGAIHETAAFAPPPRLRRRADAGPEDKSGDGSAKPRGCRA